VHSHTSPYSTLFAEAEPISKGKWHHEAESLMIDISAMGPKESVQSKMLNSAPYIAIR